MQSNATQVLVPRLQPRNILYRRLLPPGSIVEAGASGQCVPGLEPWIETRTSAEGRHHVPSPPRSGEKVAEGRLRGLDTRQVLTSASSFLGNQLVPLTQALSSVGNGCDVERLQTGERGQQ